jgi:hypothetical protein
MKQPRVPMLPNELPQQRIYAVEDIPPIPEGLEVEISYGLPSNLKHPPRNPAYLFQAEWAWSPNHGKVNAYYLHKGRRDWTLYLTYFDEDQSPWGWSPKVPVARSTLKQLDERQAAFLLTIAILSFDKETLGVGRFHMINDEGLLAVADLQAIARRVWPS